MITLKKWGHKSTLICAFLFSASLCSCDLLNKLGLEEKSSLSQPEVTAESVGTTVMSAKEKRAFYRWLFDEMHQQVYLHKSASDQDENAWLNVLFQGASIEGVYHGLVLSKSYSEQEKGIANPAAVRFFAQEAVFLKTGKDKIDDAMQRDIEGLTKDTLNFPLFSLKRELGELILSEIEHRKGDREKLAEWYSHDSARLAATGIDFGMPQRSRPDLEFHKHWALSNSLGLLQWEMLNRAHRALNHFGGAVQDKK